MRARHSSSKSGGSHGSWISDEIKGGRSYSGSTFCSPAGLLPTADRKCGSLDRLKASTMPALLSDRANSPALFSFVVLICKRRISRGDLSENLLNITHIWRPSCGFGDVWGNQGSRCGTVSLLQDCLNANPYSAGCPVDDQHCRESEQHQIFDRNCHSIYGAQLEIKK